MQTILSTIPTWILPSTSLPGILLAKKCIIPPISFVSIYGENFELTTVLTSRSIYLVIFNLADVTASRVEYWLEMVKVRAGSSSPTILVGTHKDDKKCDKKYVADVLAEMKKKYNRFSFLRGIVAVSCKTGSGLPSLKQLIVDTAFRMGSIKEEVPKSYVLLETEIRNRRRENQTMTFPKFRELALSCNIDASTSSTLPHSHPRKRTRCDYLLQRRWCCDELSRFIPDEGFDHFGSTMDRRSHVELDYPQTFLHQRWYFSQQRFGSIVEAISK